MLIELLGDVPVLIGKRKWWVGFEKTVNEHGLCLFIYFKFYNWYICLCCSFLSVQLLLQPSADIVGVVEHFSLEIQTQSRLPETSALGFLVF